MRVYERRKRNHATGSQNKFETKDEARRVDNHSFIASALKVAGKSISRQISDVVKLEWEVADP